MADARSRPPTRVAAARTRSSPASPLLGFAESFRVYLGGITMHWRSLFVVCLAAVVLALTASPALAAYGPLWSQSVDGAARLVAGTDGTIVVWAADEGGGTSALLAMRYSRAGVPLSGTATTLVDGITGLDGWVAAADGSRTVSVVWKADGSVYATRVQMGGSVLYAPVAICTDAAVTTLRETSSTAQPVELSGDGAGGLFVSLKVTPTSDDGDTLLQYVSPLGVVAAADPGVTVPEGTVAAMSGDSTGNVFVLLSSPGRNGLAVQKYDTDLEAVWGAPVSPYNPLVSQPSAATPEVIDIVSTSTATIAWREGAKVKAQRFSATGTRLWLRPTALTMSGDVLLAGDGYAGCYLVGPSATGIVTRHILASGLEADAPGSSLSLGLTTPQVDAVASNRSGDLTVAYSDAAVSPTGESGAARMTFLGAWTAAGLSPSPDSVSALEGDGVGGAYALGAGVDALVWHVGENGLALTFRPRATTVKYGRSVGISGYLTTNAEPLAATSVTLRGKRGSVSVKGLTATTDATGLYKTTLTPRSNLTWSATGGGTTSDAITIGVVPRLTMSLSHSTSGGRMYEHFTGKVAPAHRGARVRAQYETAGGWVTVAAGTIDSRSRFHITWRLPNRTKTYHVRVILPAHSDHLQGASPTATLRVVFKRG